MSADRELLARAEEQGVISTTPDATADALQRLCGLQLDMPGAPAAAEPASEPAAAAAAAAQGPGPALQLGPAPHQAARRRQSPRNQAAESAPWTAQYDRELLHLMLSPAYQQAALGGVQPAWSLQAFSAFARHLGQPREVVLLAGMRLMAGSSLAPGALGAPGQPGAQQLQQQHWSPRSARNALAGGAGALAALAWEGGA